MRLLIVILAMLHQSGWALSAPLAVDFAPYYGWGDTSFGGDLKSSAGASLGVLTQVGSWGPTEFHAGGRYLHSALYAQDQRGALADTLASRHNILALAGRMELAMAWLPANTKFYTDTAIGLGNTSVRRSVNSPSSYQEDVYSNLTGLLGRLEVGARRVFSDGLSLNSALFWQRYQYKTANPESRYSETLDQEGELLNLFGDSAQHEEVMPKSIAESTYGLSIGVGYKW